MKLPLLAGSVGICIIACALADREPIVVPTVGELRPALKGERLASQAEISSLTAEEIALSARKGLIREVELETEGGGSGLRYSFVIGVRGHDYEVGVDAKTGEVLENALERTYVD